MKKNYTSALQKKKSLLLETLIAAESPNQPGSAHCNPCIFCGWLNVHLCWPEVTSHVTISSEGLWEGGQLSALTGLPGAQCHIPGALGLPLEPPATDPSDSTCASASEHVTAECGRGRSNKQNSWRGIFPLIASRCTTTFVPQFISHLQKCTLLNSRPCLRD